MSHPRTRLVLVIDAGPAQRDALCRQLHARGLSVTGAADFTEALATLGILKPDALIADIEPTDWQWAQWPRATEFFLYSALSPLEVVYADPHSVFLKPTQLAALLNAVEQSA